VFLWASAPEADTAEVLEFALAWLRRFDIEHLFRFLKQYLAWATPRLRSPDAADRWTILVAAAWTQLWLARSLVADHVLPWEQPQALDRLSPLRVKRGFRILGPDLARPAKCAKPTIRGPGRPPGRPNLRRARRWRPGISPKTPEQHLRSDTDSHPTDSTDQPQAPQATPTCPRTPSSTPKRVKTQGRPTRGLRGRRLRKSRLITFILADFVLAEVLEVREVSGAVANGISAVAS
jgi:hypothetical protein